MNYVLFITLKKKFDFRSDSFILDEALMYYDALYHVSHFSVSRRQ